MKRYLAAFEYRFNRRFDLDKMVERLVCRRNRQDFMGIPQPAGALDLRRNPTIAWIIRLRPARPV